MRNLTIHLTSGMRKSKFLQWNVEKADTLAGSEEVNLSGRAGCWDINLSSSPYNVFFTKGFFTYVI